MKKETKNINTEVAQEQLPKEWQDQVHEAAKRFNLPIPTEIDSPQEVEQRLRWAEQEGGE